MKSLSKVHAEAIQKMRTEQEKISAAADVMIERPLKLIKAVMLKHEQAVIEVMSELKKDNDTMRELLERAEVEMRYAMWGVELKDNVGRNAILADIQEFLK